MKIRILLVVFLIGPCSFSQQEDSTDVKVGLVLSGGGAKGLAHVGALKVIEASGVRIDYIGGTSMGAIVGALYASGYSAHQLDSIFRAVDFNTLIQDELPRSAKTFYEKEGAERYALTLPFDDFKVSFPKGISSGQNVYNLLEQLTAHVSNIHDFEQLPIPFLCIATDVELGVPIVLEHGYLAEAISASGAFPSLFKPLMIEDQLLIDGGVTNNYPIDEILEKGIDVVIGVDVQDDLAERETLTTAPDILLQINNYRTVQDMEKKRQKTDIYIKPDIKDFTVISFDQGAEIIANGETGANEKLGQLRKLARRQKVNSKKRGVTIADSLTIDGYYLRGDTRFSRAYIKGKLRLKELPITTSYEKFHQGISNLVATGNFDQVRHKLIDAPEGKHTLQLNLEDTPNTMFLRAGVHYDDLYKSAALLNLTKKRLVFDDDAFSFDFILGDNIRYNIDYHVDRGFYWTWGVKSRYNKFVEAIQPGNFDIFGESDLSSISRLDLRVQDFTNQVYFQTVIREEFAFGMGVEHKFLRYDTETLTDAEGEEVVFERSNFYGPFGYLKLDTYNKRYFPTKGLFFDGQFNAYLFSNDFTGDFSEFSIAKAKMGFATPIIDKVSFHFTTEGGLVLGSTELNTFNFVFGGFGNEFINNFVPFYGYDFLSFDSNSFVKATFNLDYEFYKENHLNFAANFANADEDIFKDGEWLTSPEFSGYAVGYGLETFLGPMQVKYTWSPETDKALWLFSMGFWF